MSDREEQIRRRAYEIWERDGRPEGREAEHWRQAAQEIEAEENAAAIGGASGTPPEPKKSGAGRGGKAAGLASPLQPGGTTPGASPATSVGSMGTGGGSTGRRATGNAKKTAG